MQALQIHAGPRALTLLRDRRLLPGDVRVIPAAAGGPKGLVLGALDRFLFGDWLAGSAHSVHLLRASIGAWRMTTACLPDPAAAFAQLADDYIAQDYQHAPGKPPTPCHVSEVFGAKLAERFGGYEALLLRVVFSDAREALPIGCTTTAAMWRHSAPPTCGRRCWRVARSRSGSTPCTTYPAHRKVPTGTAASPTTTCTWTTRRCNKAWCCIRTSRRAWCPAGSTRR